MPRLGEIALIADYFAPLATSPGSFKLTDDAALIGALPKTGLVVTVDAIVAGVHFFEDDDPADVAYKAIAVNISDLAAKAAKPLSYLMTLALAAAPTEDWARSFAAGLERAQRRFGISLLGGDTVSARGAWWVSITALGEASSRGLVQRSGAEPGDHLYVTGTLGDAAAGLKLRLQEIGPDTGLSEADRRYLLRRYLLPEPRLDLVPALTACASAAMDISDGLALDLARLCAASGVSAEVLADLVPLSSAARHAMATVPEGFELILSGGDDYEILAAIPPADAGQFEEMGAKAGVSVTRIGTIVPGSGPPRYLDRQGTPLNLSRRGFEHF